MHSLCLGLAFAIGAPGIKDPPKKEAPSIVGEWEFVSGVVGGMDYPKPAGGATYKFGADGSLVVKQGNQISEGYESHKVDNKKVPFELDLCWHAMFKSPVIRGIYKIKGNALVICVPHDARGTDERPKTFESPIASTTYVITLKKPK